MVAATRLIAPAATTAAVAVREVGVIDLGSNTARLDVFEATEGGSLRTVFESKEVPRLGQGLAEHGRLTPAAMDRGVATMKRFAREIDVWGRPVVVGVATSAIRDAANGREFLRRVRRESGIELRIISGEEEARYAYLGTAAAWPLADDLVLDVGGGSIQLAATRDGAFERAGSAPLGVLRLTERFLVHDPPKRKELDLLRAHVRSTLVSLPVPPRRTYGRMYGIGGTIRCLARVAILLSNYPVAQVHGYPLGVRELRALGSILEEMPADRRREVPGISGHRADVVVAGVIVVQELLTATGLDHLTVSGNGIRQGVAVEVAGIAVPASAETLARRSVLGASRAFSFSFAHAEDVRGTAVTLFDLLKSRRRWSEADRLALSVGAWMHDVGTAIEEWRHPLHSAYILRHTPIHGVTHREILMAALAAYMHEGDPVPEGWCKGWKSVLTPEDAQVAHDFGAILAVAEELAGLGAKFRGTHTPNHLRLTLPHPSGAAARTRLLGRVARRLRRELGVELEGFRG
jgi:exopolyphosphatase / guanosine-5'-triphosphate,3'-diphosphate pyrophosphatase